MNPTSTPAPPDLSSLRGVQYMDTGWFGIFLTLVLISFILFNIRRANKNNNLFIRRISGLNAIEEAIGRATEMGRPVLMVPGLGDLNANSMQALRIFSHITKIAAKFANPIRVCCAVAPVYTVAQEIIRDTYQAEGMIDRYDPDSVQFVSDRQFAFAAGVSGIILREKVAAAFFMGEFFAESLIFAETANSTGAIQIASSTESTQTPFFIAACDYVLIGDEFFAASAYLTRQPVLVGSLVGQDWSKMTVMGFVAAGAIAVTAVIGPFGGKKVTEARVDTEMKPIKEEFKDGSPVATTRFMTKDDTGIVQLFIPQKSKDWKVERKVPEPPTATIPNSEAGKPAAGTAGVDYTVVAD